MTSPKSERLVFGYYVRIEDGRFGGDVEGYGSATVTKSACYARRFPGKEPAERYAKRVTALTGAEGESLSNGERGAARGWLIRKRT